MTMVVEFRAVRGDTATLMRSLLTERGVQLGDNGDAVVSWGVRLHGDTRPSLNASAGWDKLDELTTMGKAGVRIPAFSLDGAGLQFPILGRKRQHTKAKDIIPILQNDKEFEWRKAGGASDYFVQYIPKKAEYRVWAYRRRSLAVYEKQMRYPERYVRGVGWNWQQGFAFVFVPEAPEELKQLGAAAVDALGLDFGAVDILHGMDGQYHALEVNTAPGVQEARTGIAKLADKIAKWVELGCPKRRGQEDVR
jgi:hypothetical protein